MIYMTGSEAKVSGLAKKNGKFLHVISQNLFDAENHEKLIEELEGTNINLTTLLTTDYLNHFSAIFMILEMLPSDPKMFAADILGWEPKTYAEHMTESGFRDSELAIMCYEHASADVRKAFDKIIAQLEDAAKLIIERLSVALENDRMEDVQQICDDGIPQMRQLVEDAASIVNGDNDLIADICDEISIEDHIPPEEHSTSSQAEIDALFD